MSDSCAVLLVEDDPDFLDILRRRLLRRGLVVVACDDVAPAVEAAKKQQFDVAIVDRTLPGGDGIELVQQLVALDARLKVIMLSGRIDQLAVDEAKRAGVCQYLSKPCTLAALESAVQQACPGRKSV